VFSCGFVLSRFVVLLWVRFWLSCGTSG